MLEMLNRRRNWLIAKKMRSTVISMVGCPAENGERRLYAGDQGFLLIHLHPAAPGEKSQGGIKKDEEADKSPGAAAFPPGDARSQDKEQGGGKEEQQVAKIPKHQGGEQEAGIKYPPGAWVEGLDQRSGSFSIPPGDKHISVISDR